MACELRTKLESCKTAKFTSVSTTETKAKGVLRVVGSTIGFPVENVGTSGEADHGTTYPHGPDGVLVYEAEKALLDLVSGTGVGVLETIYYDAAGGSGKVTPVSTANTACGKALETVGTTATQVLADLIVLS